MLLRLTSTGGASFCSQSGISRLVLTTPPKESVAGGAFHLVQITGVCVCFVVLK